MVFCTLLSITLGGYFFFFPSFGPLRSLWYLERFNSKLEGMKMVRPPLLYTSIHASSSECLYYTYSAIPPATQTSTYSIQFSCSHNAHFSSTCAEQIAKSSHRYCSLVTAWRTFCIFRSVQNQICASTQDLWSIPLKWLTRCNTYQHNTSWLMFLFSPAGMISKVPIFFKAGDPGPFGPRQDSVPLNWDRSVSLNLLLICIETISVRHSQWQVEGFSFPILVRHLR